MKMSRRDRKKFNMGKNAGYYEGYVKGLHDGNPLLIMAEAISKVAETVASLSPEQMHELLEIESEASNEDT